VDKGVIVSLLTVIVMSQD